MGCKRYDGCISCVLLQISWHLQTQIVKNRILCDSLLGTKKRVPRLTGTKLKYRNETEIPERNTKIIGKHIQVPKWFMNNTNAFLTY